MILAGVWTSRLWIDSRTACSAYEEYNMSFLPLENLRSGAHELGIELSDSQLRQFDEFAALLVEANKSINLTRITEPEEIITSHFLDSLTTLSALDIAPNANVIDVGTGAGFPGVPIKIVRPDISITLLDATQKKLDFIRDSVDQIGLQDIEVVHARAEDIGHNPKFRERYDVAYARALSEMKVLAELCLPLVRVGGHLVAQKSENIDEEVKAAKPIVGQLGGILEKTVRTAIPGTDIVRQLIVIVKAKPTPTQYPRHYSRITSGKR